MNEQVDGHSDNSVPRVGRDAPDFALECVEASDQPPRLVQRSDYMSRWLMLIFYPRDFSFVCPTELTAFSDRIAEFQDRGCDVLGISVDSIDLHREWLATPLNKGGLGNLQFPLVSDPDGQAARAYGVWVEEKRVSTRGLFIIDPGGVLEYSVMHNLNVGRSPDEVLRVLDALQTGRLCPASWTSADGTIDPEQALQPGRILGHYRIRKAVGSGTFGTVFSALDMQLERIVALKILKRNLLDSRNAVLVEARAAAKLNHPNLCTVYSVEEVDGLPVISMEYLRGRPLSDRIAAGLGKDAAVRIAEQVASGLAAAHQQDVVHGDLKPANIIVTEFDTPKILDFGLSTPHELLPASPDILPDLESPAIESTILVDTADPDATMDRPSASSVDTDQPERTVLRGTPAYMSPEQAIGLPATSASDVFSFGLVLFELLTGQSAFRQNSIAQLLEKLRQANLASELASQVQPPFQPLLSATLAREADQRPPIAEVAEQLAHVSTA